MTIAEFCRMYNVTPKSFHSHKKRRPEQTISAFAKAVLPQELPTQRQSKEASITLVTSVGELIFPAQISPNVIIDVIKGLQS